MATITIEISDEESELFRKFCFLRVTKRAIDLLRQTVDELEDDTSDAQGMLDDIESNIGDLKAIQDSIESVRTKIVNQLLAAKQA